MIIEGKHNSAKVFTDKIDQKSIDQIKLLLDQEAFKDSKIRIMPDVHYGAGCVIGLYRLNIVPIGIINLHMDY